MYFWVQNNPKFGLTSGTARILFFGKPYKNQNVDQIKLSANSPPLPRKTVRHRRHNSDSTINSSYDTDELDEYFLSTPSSPINTYIADEVTKHILRKPTTVCCPYCLGYFFHHQELQEHLLQSHSEELYSLKNDEYHNIMPEICPCCQAEFLKVSI